MSQNVHDNHRERMRIRYLQQGPDGFATHELLELFLYHAIPRGDVNSTAHLLLEEHRGLSGVMSAEIDALCLTEGVGPKSALMLNIAGALFRRCAIESRPEVTVFDSCRKAREFIEPYYMGLKVERVYCMLFDNSMRLIDFFHVCDGTINEAYPIARTIARRALLKNASAVIVAHNHPDGFAIATAQDRDFTNKLEQALKLIGTVLLEHLLFGDGCCIPLLQKNACMLRTSPTEEDNETFYTRFYADMNTDKRSTAELLGLEEKGI